MRREVESCSYAELREVAAARFAWAVAVYLGGDVLGALDWLEEAIIVASAVPRSSWNSSSSQVPAA